MLRYIFILFTISFLSGCATLKPNKIKHNQQLMKFAYANCLMWYFKGKKYNTDDITAISGGIVETSNISINKFQEIALFIRNYNPELKTKQNIDKKLLRCFHLENSNKLKEIILK